MVGGRRTFDMKTYIHTHGRWEEKRRWGGRGE